MARHDLIGIIEAAYRLDLDEPSWIRGVTDAAAPLLDEGHGVAGYLLDLSKSGPPAHTPVFVGDRDPWNGDWRKQWWEARVLRMPSSLVADLAGFGSPTYASQSCGAVMRGAMVARLSRDIPPIRLPDGVREALVVSGLDTSGAGAVLFAFRGEQAIASPNPKLTARWQRLSGHLAAALRLRRRRSIAPVDGPRDTIRTAMRSVERARMRRHRHEDESLELWPALSRDGTTIVPTEGGGGFVAIPNTPSSPLFVETLTPRERAAIALLCLGRSNKAIAYELGVAPSTVSSFLSSAARKLGVRGVAGLIGQARSTVHAYPRASSLARSAGLSEAETVVLCLLLAGLADAEISKIRGATRSTVTKQVDAVFRKLNVDSRRELLACASSLAPWHHDDRSGT